MVRLLSPTRSTATKSPSEPHPFHELSIIRKDLIPHGQESRTGPREARNPRKYKKKTSPLVIEKVEYVDYKDVDLLSRFMSDRAKIRNMRVSGNDRQQQAEVAKAIKIAREMALLPYANRVASAPRGGRRDRDGDRRPPRDEGQDSQVEGAAEEATDEDLADAGVEVVEVVEVVETARPKRARPDHAGDPPHRRRRTRQAR